MKSLYRAAALAGLFLLPAWATGQTVKEVFAYPVSAQGPLSLPAQGRDGSVFTTAGGFGYGTTNTDGAIIRTPISSKGGQVLHAFTEADGAVPLSGVTLAMDGNLYGVTYNGGTSSSGVLYKITTGGTYTVVHEFSAEADGGFPVAAPIQGSDGNLYGTTSFGNVDDGTVYKYNPSAETFATLFSFSQDGSHGAQIEAPLIQASDGNLYGTTEVGGTNNCGTIFELSISGALLYTYSFPCGAEGEYPYTPLIQASDGNFYGTTFYGGNITSSGECKTGCGTIFKMSNGVVSTLYSFSGYPNDGANADSGLTEGTDGNLYGITTSGGAHALGTIYQIASSGQYKLLYSFVGVVGSSPGAPLLQHTNGSFYGTAFHGGQNKQGSLYRLDMGLGPFIALVRYTGRIGQPVQILGQGLTGSTTVTVNGIAATSLKVASDTYMTAVIPTGATTGPVVVTTPTGTLTSNHNFRIVQ